MKIKKIVLTLLISITVSNAASDTGKKGNRQVATDEGSGYVIGLDVPRNPERPRSEDGIERTRIEVGTKDNRDTYKYMQLRKQERLRILNEVFDPAILMSPTRRTIRPVDIMGISPHYITQIIFPSDMEIVEPMASFKCTILKHKKNLLWIRPDADTFFSGNFVLTLTDGRKNYSMTIFVDRYYQKDCKVEGDKYICRKNDGTQDIHTENSKKHNATYAYNNLSTLYIYENPKELAPMEAIIMYESIVRKTLDIQNIDDVVSFQYQGLTYDIIRNETSGTVSYRGKKYIVEARG